MIMIMKCRKLLLGFAIAILGEAIAMAQASSIQEGAMSVRKLEDGLYFMEYRGEDGFAGLVERGGARSAGEMSNYVMGFIFQGLQSQPQSPQPGPAEYGCSALTVRTPEGVTMMGRNFDFSSATGMVLHTVPEYGYETYTTFNLDFLSFGEGWVPEGMQNQYMALSVLFFALDGVNEKGLAMADLMAGDDVQTHQESGKPALTTTTAICYLLKNAANVDEALELLRGIDMHSDIGAAHHYAISDASGRSVVVEYVDNQMIVVESNAVANHYLCEAKRNVGLIEGDCRYENMLRSLEDADGKMTEKQLTDVMSSVSQMPVEGKFLGTAWTMIMDLGTPSVTYYSRRNFESGHRFEFERSGRGGKCQ